MTSLSQELMNPSIPVPAEMQSNIFITSLDKIYN